MEKSLDHTIAVVKHPDSSDLFVNRKGDSAQV